MGQSTDKECCDQRKVVSAYSIQQCVSAIHSRHEEICAAASSCEIDSAGRGPGDGVVCRDFQDATDKSLYRCWVIVSVWSWDGDLGRSGLDQVALCKAIKSKAISSACVFKLSGTILTRIAGSKDHMQ